MQMAVADRRDTEMRQNTMVVPVRTLLVPVMLIALVGCANGTAAPPDESGGGSGAGTQAPAESQLPVLESSEAATSGAGEPVEAGLPADPCVPVVAAIEALDWVLVKSESGTGPGGPNTQCTFGANRADTTYENGWVAYIPAAQMPLEYHTEESIAGVGVEAFRGSPQSGEILATGASPGFRLFVATGDKGALDLAKSLVGGG
jgi:hypothetical protein